MRREWLSKVKGYSLPKPPGRVIARLHMNENPFPPPKRVVERALEAVVRGNRYPDPRRVWYLRELAARYYSLPGPEWVLPTLGSDTALKLTFEVFALMGTALAPFPSFQAYPAIAAMSNTKLDFVELEVDYDARSFRLKEEFWEEAEKYELVVVDTPNNPTGSFLEVREVEKPILLIDEAYADIAGKSYVDLVKKRDNVIVTRTLSKVFGLAGFRVGFLISNPDVVSMVEKMTLPYDLPSPSVEAAIAALEEPSYIERYKSHLKKWKDIISREVEKKGWKAFRSETNFVLVETDVNGIVEALAERGILVRGVPLGKNWFRVSIGSDEEMNAFIDVLREF